MDEAQTEGSTTESERKLEVALIAKLNLADFQYAVPLVRDLFLINETDQAHEQVELILTSDAPFLKPRRWRIDALAARSRYPIRNLDLNLDGGLQARLTEAETATVSLALRAAAADASNPCPHATRNPTGVTATQPMGQHLTSSRLGRRVHAPQ